MPSSGMRMVRAVTSATRVLSNARPNNLFQIAWTSPPSSLECPCVYKWHTRSFTTHTHLYRSSTTNRRRNTPDMPLLDLLGAVTTAIQEADIIPDVIPDAPKPQTSTQSQTQPQPPLSLESFLVVKWPTGKEALLGNPLTTIDTADEPTVSFTPMPSFEAATDVGYTLVMTDPDAPSREDPRMGQWRHWLMTGLKAPALTGLDTGDLAARVTRPAATSYHPPAPPRGTGFHRYVFLLYQEPGTEMYLPADAEEHKSGSKDRAHWNAAKFAERYGLKLVGVNYCTVKAD